MAAPMYNPAMGMPPGMEPPEVSSLKSLLNVSRIITLVFGVLFLLVGVVAIAVAVAFAGALGFFSFFILIWFVVDLIIYMQLGEVRTMIDHGQLVQAKDKMLIWWILGFIFGGIIIGILLLVTWLKFDSAIAAVQRQQGGWAQPPMAAAPVWQAPPTATPPTAAAPQAAPAAAPSPAAAPAAPAAPQAMTCPRCGRPATWIAQYSRWYCYNDQQYV